MYIVRATQQILKMVNPERFINNETFCVCSRSCMVMAAHAVREERQVNAPRTVRKLALALNRLRLSLHPPPRYSWKFFGVRIRVPPSPLNPDPFSDQKNSFSTPVFRSGLYEIIIGTMAV